MQLGRTVAELERSLSFVEYQHWLAFYHHIEPFGEQRADMRSALVVRATQGGTVSDHMLFPDDRHEIPDDVSAAEQAMMLKMQRLGGHDGE